MKSLENGSSTPPPNGEDKGFFWISEALNSGKKGDGEVCLLVEFLYGSRKNPDIFLIDSGIALNSEW